jgi:hypothetical protein
MKKIVLRYGSYSALFELISFVLVWLLLTNVKIGLDLQGKISWFVIVGPLIFVYFGIRYYRDHINNGSITFFKALQIGLLIILIPAVAYAIIETVYVEYLDPNFYANIGMQEMELYRKTLPPAEVAIKIKEMKQELALNKNPFYNFAVMVLVIYALGTILTVISALILQRRKAGQIGV